MYKIANCILRTHRRHNLIIHRNKTSDEFDLLLFSYAAKKKEKRMMIEDKQSGFGHNCAIMV